MDSLTLIRNTLCKAKMEYHGKFGHTIFRVHHIDIMSRIDIVYTAFRLGNHTMATTVTGFQGLKL